MADLVYLMFALGAACSIQAAHIVARNFGLVRIAGVEVAAEKLRPAKPFFRLPVPSDLLSPYPVAG